MIRLALIQAPPVFLNLAESLQSALGHIESAADDGADIVVFPESWLPGYPVWLDEAPGAALWDNAGARQLYRLLSENALTLGGAEIATLVRTAQRTGAVIVMGAHEKRGGTLYNTTLIVTPEGKVAPHRKLAPTYTERLVWGMGDGATLAAVETAFGVVGGLICWEHWMPLARAAMHAKHEALHIAQWPTVNEIHQVASRHYAFEGRCFVAASGCLMTRGDVLAGVDSLGAAAAEARALLDSIPGPDERLLQRGGSCVIGPDGAFVIEPVFERAGIVTANVDLAALAEHRLTLDTAGHYSRPDIFELHVDTSEKPGVIETGDSHG